MDLSKITTYQAGVIQASANRKLQKITDAILLQYGLTKMQWFIIGTVLDAGSKGIRLSELSERLGTTMSYLTNTVNILESRRILDRKSNEEDTRSKIITVNASYVSKCSEIEKTLRNGMRGSIYSQIDPVDFKTYIKVMDELASIDLDVPH